CPTFVALRSDATVVTPRYCTSLPQLSRCTIRSPTMLTNTAGTTTLKTVRINNTRRIGLTTAASRSAHTDGADDSPHPFGTSDTPDLAGATRAASAFL